MEAGASALLTWDALAITGLLQTHRYAEAIIRGGDQQLTAADVAQRLDLRLQRQQLLDQPTPPALHVVLDEAVLRRQVSAQVCCGTSCSAWPRWPNART